MAPERRGELWNSRDRLGTGERMKGGGWLETHPRSPTNPPGKNPGCYYRVASLDATRHLGARLASQHPAPSRERRSAPQCSASQGT